MPNIPRGKTILTWQIPEFTAYQRGWLWYVLASLIALALIIYGLVTTNFLFSIIIFIFALIIALSIVRQPENREVRLTEIGLEIGEKLYPYRSFERFAIVYEPPEVKKLYLDFKTNLWQSQLMIPLENQNPTPVRNLLLEARLKENLEGAEEPFSEILSRLFKI